MSRIKQFAAAQTGRGFLWLVLLFALGIALYYAIPVEPDWRYLLALCAFLTLFTLWPHGRHRWRWGLLLIPMLGATWASAYTAMHHPVMLKRELTPRPITGIVADIERVEKGFRFTLDEVTIRGLDPAATPKRVRLSVRLKPGSTLALPHIGDRVDMLAGLLPPMGAALPGGFDFARYFYFRDIGAVGYGLPPWKIIAPAKQTGFAQWRLELTESIISTLGPERGPIAAGLITGEDRAIREADFNALRASNLYHIIAISGGHMVVIAGVIFVGLRLLLLFLPFGLRPQAKSIAAAVTLIMVTLYLFVTGLPISAVRAYVMIALVLIAVILRRDADAMRSLLLAGLIMLLFDPSDLLEPGFQLSFVATMAIVALAEGLWLRNNVDSRWRKLFGILIASVLVSLVAEGAVSLLVARMFNNFALYGVLANALATPLVAFALMPAVALFFVLLPFGAQGAALWLMDYGIRAMMWIARTASDLPHAQMFLPSPPDWGLGVGILGLLFVCLVRGRIRWIGLLGLAVGWVSVFTATLPHLLVGTHAKQIALQTEQGYALLRGRPDSLVPELWANGLGMKTLPILKSGQSDAWRCDRFGCMARLQGDLVAFPHSAEAAIEDCSKVKLMLTTIRGIACGRWVIGPYTLARTGVQAFWWEGDGYVRHENSAQWQDQRPWSTMPATPAWRQ